MISVTPRIEELNTQWKMEMDSPLNTSFGELFTTINSCDMPVLDDQTFFDMASHVSKTAVSKIDFTSRLRQNVREELLNSRKTISDAALCSITMPSIPAELTFSMTRLGQSPSIQTIAAFVADLVRYFDGAQYQKNKSNIRGRGAASRKAAQTRRPAPQQSRELAKVEKLGTPMATGTVYAAQRKQQNLNSGISRRKIQRRTRSGGPYEHIAL